ncbi:MAG: hypothetical protein ACYSTX_00565 [Planctomycetota bacterium]|jgi:hypothetical protein
MIKTLHITSIIIGILTISIIAFGSFLGDDTDEEAVKFLQSPSAIEKFNAAKDKRVSKRGIETSPLVKEAKAYALYLNPPPKPESKTKSATRTNKKAKPKRPTAPVSTKFKLIGTAYYPLNPKASMALIDQPGKGLSWVRQGKKVEHLIFEQIKDGVVVIRDGQKTREMKTPTREEDQAIQKFIASGPKGSRRVSTGKTSSRSVSQPAVTPEEMKTLQEAFSKVLGSALQEGTESNEPGINILDNAFSSLSKTRINDNEANRLRALGETLEEAQDTASDDPNLEQSDLESNINPILDKNLDLDLDPNSNLNFDPNLDPNR